jgi:ribosomal protein S18 acetylase RimI-like enzyme
MSKCDRTLKLIPASVRDFEVWKLSAVVAYAQTNVKAGIWGKSDAAERSTNVFGKLLPDGVQSPDHYFYVAMAPDDSQPKEQPDIAVGYVWIWIKNSVAARKAFIYDIKIDESKQGKGYGRALLLQTEAKAIELGAAEISLNVFEHNVRALRLYESSGFNFVTHQMTKTLIQS